MFEPGEQVQVAPEHDAMHGQSGTVLSHDGIVWVDIDGVKLCFEPDELESVQEQQNEEA